MQVFRHPSSNSTYGFRRYYYNIPESVCHECDIVRQTVEKYRTERANEMLHEIAHSVFSSDNPEETARIYECAPAMLKMLKRVASDKEICLMRDINRLIDYINGKEVD